MAWIVKLPPTPRHPQTRWQVRYRDGTIQRSAGIYPTKAEALSVKRAVERGDHVAYPDQLSPEQACMLFGEYVTTIWWPAWKPPIPLHPRHQEQAHRPDPPPLRRPPPRPARRPRHRRLAARHDPRG